MFERIFVCNVATIRRPDSAALGNKTYLLRCGIFGNPTVKGAPIGKATRRFCKARVRALVFSKPTDAAMVRRVLRGEDRRRFASFTRRFSRKRPAVIPKTALNAR